MRSGKLKKAHPTIRKENRGSIEESIPPFVRIVSASGYAFLTRRGMLS